jgi:hypothetical protein
MKTPPGSSYFDMAPGAALTRVLREGWRPERNWGTFIVGEKSLQKRRLI